MAAGKPQKQALAIAYSVARKAQRKFKGGEIVPDADEGSIEEQHADADEREHFSDDENMFLVADEPEEINEEPPGNTDGDSDQAMLRELMKRRYSRR